MKGLRDKALLDNGLQAQEKSQQSEMKKKKAGDWYIANLLKTSYPVSAKEGRSCEKIRA